jgi:hypothetical protein
MREQEGGKYAKLSSHNMREQGGGKYANYDNQGGSLGAKVLLWCWDGVIQKDPRRFVFKLVMSDPGQLQICVTAGYEETTRFFSHVRLHFNSDFSLVV